MVPIILGAFLIVMGIVADRFTVGLRGRIQVSAWQGRASPLLFGSGLLLVGLAHVLQWWNEAMWQRMNDGIWNGYEVFVGGGMMVLGVVFAVAGKSTIAASWRWFGLAVSVAGAIFLFDGVTKILN